MIRRTWASSPPVAARSIAARLRPKSGASHAGWARPAKTDCPSWPACHAPVPRLRSGPTGSSALSPSRAQSSAAWLALNWACAALAPRRRLPNRSILDSAFKPRRTPVPLAPARASGLLGCASCRRWCPAAAPARRRSPPVPDPCAPVWPARMDWPPVPNEQLLKPRVVETASPGARGELKEGAASASRARKPQPWRPARPVAGSPNPSRSSGEQGCQGGTKR